MIIHLFTKDIEQHFILNSNVFLKRKKLRKMMCTVKQSWFCLLARDEFAFSESRWYIGETTPTSSTHRNHLFQYVAEARFPQSVSRYWQYSRSDVRRSVEVVIKVYGEFMVTNRRFKTETIIQYPFSFFFHLVRIIQFALFCCLDLISTFVKSNAFQIERALWDEN